MEVTRLSATASSQHSGPRLRLEDGCLQFLFEHSFKVKVSGHELFFHIIECPLVICQLQSFPLCLHRREHRAGR